MADLIDEWTKQQEEEKRFKEISKIDLRMAVLEGWKDEMQVEMVTRLSD
jgi:hypothetical protein